MEALAALLEGLAEELVDLRDRIVPTRGVLLLLRVRGLAVVGEVGRGGDPARGGGGRGGGAPVEVGHLPRVRRRGSSSRRVLLHACCVRPDLLAAGELEAGEAAGGGSGHRGSGLDGEIWGGARRGASKRAG